MMSIKEFATLRQVSVFTVYSWIQRGTEKKNGFKVIRIGAHHIINPVKNFAYVKGRGGRPTLKTNNK